MKRGVLAGALLAESAEEVAGQLGVHPELFAIFGEALPAALGGEWAAVQALVSGWHFLVGDLLVVAAAELPDLVAPVDDHLGILTAARQLSDEPVDYLQHLISEIPFSPMVATFGSELGVGVAAIDALRDLLPGVSRLSLGASVGWCPLTEPTALSRYRQLVEMALRQMQPPVAQVCSMFELTTKDLADLFGVTRQAVDQWNLVGEVPAARREKLANLLSVGELLERKLRPGRLPLIARRGADVYGGNTLLGMVRDDRDEELRALTFQSLDWSGVA